MQRRWIILGALFVARAAMAFQFQSTAAVAPVLSRSLGADLADIGVLIGLYFAPGAVLALPGGAIGRRLGDKVVVLAGLLLMLAGEMLMAVSASWSAQVAGRLVAGTGGVLINVLMTKMVADWFAGPDTATAMAVFVNSWPVGVAASLLVLPAVATAFGLVAVHLAVVVSIAIGIALVRLIYRPPEASMTATTGSRGSLPAGAAFAAIAAGLTWTLYNIGFAMVFGFGPSMLVERGWSVPTAGSTISIVLWLATVSVPLGGFLADRTRRGDAVLVAGVVAFAALLFLLPRTEAVFAAILILGMVCGLSAGPIMSLPARGIEPAARAIAMGVFYTVYYIGMMAGPSIGGALAAWAGNAGVALDFGAAVLLACPAVLWSFRHILSRRSPTVVPG
jgi:MFS family permease